VQPGLQDVPKEGMNIPFKLFQELLLEPQSELNILYSSRFHPK